MIYVISFVCQRFFAFLCFPHSEIMQKLCWWNRRNRELINIRSQVFSHLPLSVFLLHFLTQRWGGASLHDLHRSHCVVCGIFLLCLFFRCQLFRSEEVPPEQEQLQPIFLVSLSPSRYAPSHFLPDHSHAGDPHTQYRPISTNFNSFILFDRVTSP